MNRPPQVRHTHLSRAAIVYMRQSTQKQVEENQGSTQHQRDQAALALKWGWPADAIEVIDDDLGRSGTTTLCRDGFQAMLDAVREDRCGAIFTTCFDRIGRRFSDSLNLVEECRIHDVLVVVDGRVYDMRDPKDRLVATMLLNLAEFENDGRKQTLYNGRLARAKSGYAVSSPPAGYVKQEGEWLQDPDESVRSAVGTVFRVFLEQRSLVRTVAMLAQLGVKLPRRTRHLVRWVRPDIGSIAFMVRNRAYVGDYVFRKRRVDEALGRSRNGRLRDRPAADDEMVVIPDHHAPYVSRAQWSEMQHILDVNAPGKSRRNLGPGGAVLQGMLRCPLHRTRVMRARNKCNKHGEPIYGYTCEGNLHVGGSRCRSVPARPLERGLVTAIEAVVTPVGVEAARDAWRRLKVGEAAEERRHELELERHRRRVHDLRRRCMLVDPENRLVAAELEAEWDAAKRELARFEAQGPLPSNADVLTEAAFEELLQLAADFRLLWVAPTTENRDRKEIVRTLLDEVLIEEHTKEFIRLRLVWADGRPTTTITVPLSPWTHRRIAELRAEDLSPTQIAERLNVEGMRTLKGREWTRPTVEAALRSLRRKQAMNK